MSNGPLLFFGILVSVATSFWTLLVVPQMQIGGQPVVQEASGKVYPLARAGVARQGAAVYRAEGCVECHSHQVRQTGFSFDLWLAEAGTNQIELLAAMLRAGIPVESGGRLLRESPAKLMEGLTVEAAQEIADRLTNGGARAQVVLKTLGPDIERGWGNRGAVTQDYLHEYPVQLGNLRVGPDLSNYGLRETNVNQILLHLYDPKLTMPTSMMPKFRYLFERITLAEGEPLPARAIELPAQSGEEGSGRGAIMPKPEAEALAAYLLSLRLNEGLPEAPVPAPPQKAPPVEKQAAAK